ncbi:MAG TPA: flagellar hook-length control protein FliK, partial [Bacilli bacterium]|nr:flagellar hook-length control protein FliK [Bacilli bacterium]
VTTALQELGLPESSEETGGTPSGKTGVLTARPTSAETAAPTAQAPASRTGDTAPHFPENKISRPLPTAGDSNSLSPRPNADVLSSATRGQLQQLLTATRQLASGADLKPESLQQAVQKLGLGFEAQLAHAVRRLPAEATPEQVQTALTHALQQQETGDGPALKQMLHQLQAARPDLEAAGLQQLADDIGMLAKHVTGQQLMQGTGQERSDLVYQFAGVPVQMGDRKQTVELHIMSRKSPGQKTLDPANCYILFHLDMPQLGPLDIHLHIVDKVVGVRFLTETGEGVQIEPSEQQTLRASLQGTGYHLGVMKVEAKQQAHDGQHPPLLPPVLTKSGLDFKV